jgi:hypothetical protein
MGHLAGVLHYARLESLARDKYSSLYGPIVSYREYVHKKLESYITLGWKGLPGANTLA